MANDDIKRTFVDQKTAEELGNVSGKKDKTPVQKTEEIAKNKKAEDAVQQAATQPGSGQIGIGGGGDVYRVSDDILAGARWQKYDNVQHLEGQQQRYRPQPKQLRTINFKQDYAVLIRKKLYYAANSISNEKDDNNIKNGKGRYIRTYLVDNFTSINVSNSVHGQSPGTCSLTIKGGERVMCYEHTTLQAGGIPDVDALVNQIWPDNSSQIIIDSKNNTTNPVGDMARRSNDKIPTVAGGFGSHVQMDQPADKVVAAAQQAEKQASRQVNADGTIGDAWTKHTMNTGNDLMTNSITIQDMATPETFNVDGVDYTVQNPTAKVTVYNADGSVFNEFLIDVERDEATVQSLEDLPKSGWKFAEKCDWEEMDEVWVFGKSNFERGKGGDFKMNQIFFGYIDTVAKSYTSGGGNGCMISVTASDQLKILGLSYVTQNPSIAMGASLNGQGIDISYGYKDPKAFGTFVLANPYAAMQATRGKSMGKDGTAKEAEQAEGTTYACFAYTNVFAGMTAEEIVRKCCEDAGVPRWYMASRIEPIGWPPYVMKIKQFTSDMLFQMSTQKRLAVCQDVAKKLQIEFFADECGNIVLKCPNYALGVNTLPGNNMGLSELAGGMLHQIQTYQVTSSYWAIQTQDLETLEKSGTQDGVTSSGGPLSKEEKAAYDRMINARNQWRAAKIADSFLEKYGQDGVNGLESATAAEQINRMMDGWSEGQYLQPLVYNRLLSSENGHGVTREVLTKNSEGVWVNGNGEEYGTTLDEIAQYSKSWYNDARWDTILADPENEAVFKKAGGINRSSDGTITNASEVAANLYQCDGPLVVNYNPGLKSQDQLAREYAAAINEYQNYKKDDHKTQQDYDSMKRKFYENTLSELTDALIPEIPQEFIIGFTLTCTDKNIFNSYEVNIESDFGLFDGANTPITKLSRVFADIPSFVRFGVRPCPQPYNFPYMGNRENAHLLGFMLCARSLAQRQSATLTMIEDSFIRVGDPIRFFAYDEHPYKPLASQETVDASSYGMTDSASALNIMGRDGRSLSDANAQVNGETLLGWADHGINAVNGSKLKHSDAPQEKHVAETGNQYTGVTNDNVHETGTQIATAETGGVTIPQGNALNFSFSTEEKAPTGSDYQGVGASFAAMQTQAQSIYYVEAINRQIDISGVSKMTLNLSCGRMMGCPSVVDYMLLLYKAYYDANTGFAPDLAEINEIKKQYEGNTTTYTPLTVDDTLQSIAKKQYGIDFSALMESPENEQTDDDKYGEYALPKCTIDNPQAHELAAAQGWKFYSSKSSGGAYKGKSPHATQFAAFTYYEYDGSQGLKAVFHLESYSGKEGQALFKASGVDQSTMMCVCPLGMQTHASMMKKQFLVQLANANAGTMSTAGTPATDTSSSTSGEDEWSGETGFVDEGTDGEDTHVQQIQQGHTGHGIENNAQVEKKREEQKTAVLQVTANRVVGDVTEDQHGNKQWQTADSKYHAQIKQSKDNPLWQQYQMIRDDAVKRNLDRARQQRQEEEEQ